LKVAIVPEALRLLLNPELLLLLLLLVLVLENPELLPLLLPELPVLLKVVALSVRFGP
jgi:hypothetical protein